MDTMVGLKMLEVGTFLSAGKSWAKRTVHSDKLPCHLSGASSLLASSAAQQTFTEHYRKEAHSATGQ